jgi:NADH:ubiquinone oxidoreductase subunit 5 (subunit L)/multisubunit Na+/H+ antiporter MnhA subunit
MRLIHAAFFAKAQGTRSVFEHAHEPGRAMTIPLILLAIASVYIGYIMKDTIIGVGSPYLEFTGNWY